MPALPLEVEVASPLDPPAGGEASASPQGGKELSLRLEANAANRCSWRENQALPGSGRVKATARQIDVKQSSISRNMDRELHLSKQENCNVAILPYVA